MTDLAGAPDAPAEQSPRPGRADYIREAAQWREQLAPYARSQVWRGMLDLLTSAVAYLALSAGMVLATRVSPWLTLALSPLSAICLLRTFIVFHDCVHGSFMRTERANLWIGLLCATIVVTPFARWRHDHAIHHATSGDLDRRGIGDLPTLTVEEYRSRTPRGRLVYRLFRHPLIMFGVGPVIAMIVGPRIISRDAPRRMRRSVIATDAWLALIAAGLVWAFGPLTVLLVWAPAAILAGAAGIWLFYVQHQYEDAYWQRTDTWSYSEAALRGSSFLKLPRILQWATGNIGYHHVHHLSVRVPNYHLQRAHEGIDAFKAVPVLTLGDGVRSIRLKLWDERAGRMVTFAQAAGARA